jgi:hypothetical protein
MSVRYYYLYRTSTRIDEGVPINMHNDPSYDVCGPNGYVGGDDDDGGRDGDVDGQILRPLLLAADNHNS